MNVNIFAAPAHHLASVEDGPVEDVAVVDDVLRVHDGQIALPVLEAGPRKAQKHANQIDWDVDWAEHGNAHGEWR